MYSTKFSLANVLKVFEP